MIKMFFQFGKENRGLTPIQNKYYVEQSTKLHHTSIIRNAINSFNIWKPAMHAK